MSKQHLHALAQALANARPAPKDATEFDTRRNCVIEMANMCGDLCDQFNYMRFIDTCAKLEAK